MNSVVLKGKLGAGYIDDGKVNELDERLTAAEGTITQQATEIAAKADASDLTAIEERILPEDGSTGDILVRTETGSAWMEQKSGGGENSCNR